MIRYAKACLTIAFLLIAMMVILPYAQAVLETGVKVTTKTASGTANFVTLANNDGFGGTVAGIGDIDNDGVEDIAVGANGDDTGGAGSNRGAVYIMLLNNDGTVKATSKIASGTANFVTLANNDRFGSSVAGIGDIDNDGVEDIAVGAFFDDTGNTNRGAVYIILLNNNGTVKATSKIASGTANFVTLVDLDNFGRSVAGIGDIDNDGVEDIAAGALLDDTGGANRGAVYIIRLNNDGTVKATSKIASGTTNFVTLVDVDQFGRSVDGIGDIDNDGVEDIAAGAIGDDTGGANSNRGAVYIIRLNSDSTVKATSKIASGTDNFVTLTNDDNFGVSVAGIGDINNDGVEDIAAGAYLDDTGNTDRGAVYIIRLNSDSTVKATSKIASGTANFVTLVDSDRFGASVAGIGDIDNDGVEDIAAGADLDDTGDTNRGAAYIIRIDALGSVPDVRPTPAPKLDPAPEPVPRPR